MSHIRLERTIWPVGHGAFYTEQFKDESNQVLFTAAYDCGANSKYLIQKHIDQVTNNLTTPIDILYISHLHIDHINGLSYLLHVKTTANTPLVKKVILPHICSEDILEAIIYNFITASKDPDKQQENEEIQALLYSIAEHEFDGIISIVEEDAPDRAENVSISIDEGNINVAHIMRGNLPNGVNIVLLAHNQPIWRYKPVYYHTQGKCDKLRKEVNKLMNNKLIRQDGSIDWGALLQHLHSLTPQKDGSPDCTGLKDAYKKAFPVSNKNGKKEQTHNNYSMPVYSGPYYKIGKGRIKVHPQRRWWYIWLWKIFSMLIKYSGHCLYTGDFEANDNDKLISLFVKLGNLWDQVRLLQIPHHISDNNYNPDFYNKPMLCFGNVDDKNDKSFSISTFRKIAFQRGCFPIAITENDDCLKISYPL